jgi:hypothetical protein
VELLSLRIIIPFVLICGAGALLDGYYNYRVTGNAFVIPHNLYSHQYAVAPAFLILPLRQPPSYRHAIFEKTWNGREVEGFRTIRAHPLVNLAAVGSTVLFFCSPLCLILAALGILLCGSYRAWTAAAICFAVWCGFLIEFGKWPHYVAGRVGLLPVLSVYGLRLLRVTARNFGPALVLFLTTLLCAQAVAVQKNEPKRAREASNQFSSLRNYAIQTAMKQGGRHLIIVRYSREHDSDHEFVWNNADIDASPIVWARDMGDAKNLELVDYYHGSRKVWLSQPDTDPAVLIPYSPADQ